MNNVIIQRDLTHQILFKVQVDLLWRLEIGVEFVDQVAEGRLEHSIDNVDNQVFQPVQQVGEVDEGTLGLQMRVLGNMPSCAGLKKRLGWYGGIIRFKAGFSAMYTHSFCSV